MKSGIIFTLLFLFCSFSIQAQMETRGTDFWLAFAKNSNHETPADIVLQIKVVAEKAATVTITYTDNPAYSQTFNVPAHSAYTYTPISTRRQLMYNANYSNPVSKKSVHIQSTEPVSVYAFNEVTPSTGEALADATNVLPTAVLGTEYYHLGRVSDNFSAGNRYDQNLIIATQNGTNIFQNGIPIATNLTAGSVYYHQFLKEISGDHITSNYPVAYFSAHSFCQIAGGGDNFFQQLTPVNTWGKSFIVPVTNRGVELVRIVASQDNTTITQTGGIMRQGGQNSLTLNAGQWVELEISLSNNGCYIQSDKPVQVCTYMVGAKYPNAVNTIGGDESICWVPPIEQRVDSALISPFAVDNLKHHYALIVTPTETRDNTLVSIGGAAPSGLSGGTWYENAASGISFYNVELTNATASYLYTNHAGLIVYSYGFGQAISYYYIAGSAVRGLDATSNVKPYEIWNWEDLAKLNYFIFDNPNEFTTNHGNKAILMQNLGVFGDNNYGDGSTMSPSHPHQLIPEKKSGCYGYGVSFNFGSGPVGWNGNSGWIPIGGSGAPFVGEFDGQGFVINGLWTTDGSEVGLFGVISNSTIKNLGINIYGGPKNGIDGTMFVGALTGTSTNSTIVNCYATGFLYGGEWVGGLVGWQEETLGGTNSIINCYAMCDIDGHSELGGLVGVSMGGSIINSYATGDIKANQFAGGLVGLIDGSSIPAVISNCYATGDIEVGANFVGGLVGGASFTTISNCYAFNCILKAGDDDEGATTGRIIGGYFNITLSDNYAYKNMKMEILNVTYQVVSDPEDKDGEDMPFSDITNPSTFSNWTGNSGAWIFTPPAYNGYNVATGTNLPILKAFDPEIFNDAEQGPKIDRLCNPTFVTPSFDFNLQLEYCIDTIPIVLPTASNNDITGTWSPAAINTSQAGKITYFFTPAPDELVIGDGKVVLEVTTVNCEECAENGTLLYKQDFGGNSLSDPTFADYKRDDVYSDLIYSKTSTPQQTGYGYYNFTKNPRSIYVDGFRNQSDHTHNTNPNIGYMLFADPYTNDFNKILYETKIGGFCEGMTLYFSAWFVDVNMHVHLNVKPPKVQLQMFDGKTEQLLASSDIYTIPFGEKWVQRGVLFTVGSDTDSIIFRIYNRQSDPNGNDLAIDDVEVRLCASPVTTNLPDLTTKCEKEPLTLSGSYIDDGTFGMDLLYYWEHSLTGNILNPLEWTTVEGSDTTVSNGEAVSTYTINSLTSSHAGYYRFVVTSPLLSNSWRCRVTSEVREVKINPLPQIAPLNIPGILCLDGVITLAYKIDGVWESSNLAVATIATTTEGFVELTGVGIGTAEITYTLTNDTCNNSASVTITIDECKGCLEGGTLLYKQDFGGNGPGYVPLISPSPLQDGSSAMNFCNHTGCTHASFGNQGYYALVRNPFTLYPEGFHSNIIDHTHPDDPERGYMMFIDPYLNDYNRILYETEIDDLCQDANLYFSAWFIDVNKHVHENATSPKIEMQMIEKGTNKILASSGTQTIPSFTIGTPPGWTQIGVPFRVESGTSIIFRIYNKEYSKDGNDWAMDDIEIHLCTSPVTINSDFVEACEGKAQTLSGNYVDNEAFGKNLVYHWIYSLTGDVNTPSDWSYIEDSKDSVTNGIVASSFVIDSITSNHAGYYRLVVSSQAMIDTWYCRAMSDVITVAVKVCATVRGTVFPFVHYEEPEAANLFPIVARLYDTSLISKGPLFILNAEPIRIDTAVYYDGAEFIQETPKFPGYIGRLDNPNFPPINWAALGYTTGKTDATFLLPGEIPKTAIGWYKFENLEYGEYVLVLSRDGYVTRFAKIEVQDIDITLGHRELILGDVNGDLIVDEKDIEIIISKISQYGNKPYKARYDLNGDLRINASDISLLNFYLQFSFKLYEDTEECFSNE